MSRATRWDIEERRSAVATFDVIGTGIHLRYEFDSKGSVDRVVIVGNSEPVGQADITGPALDDLIQALQDVANVRGRVLNPTGDGQ